MAEERPGSRLQNRWILAALWLVLYGSFALLSPPLLDGADALHAEMAREMVVRGDPVTLYANGSRCLGESPLLYWFMAGSMRLFGVGAAQARLPLAISILLLTLVVEAFARQAWRSNRAGFYAASSLLLTPALFIGTRLLLPEVISCTWIAAAVFCLWRAEAMPQERTGNASVVACLGFAAACAMIVLTTGPGGLLLPVAIALLYLLLTRGVGGSLRRTAQLHPALALCVFLAIAVPWHVLVAEANPASAANGHGWAWFYFLRRYQPLLPGFSGHTAGIFASPGMLLVAGLLPWAAFMPAALRGMPWRKATRTASLSAEQQAMLLLGIAAVLPALLAVATQQLAHALPALPFLCMLTARWLGREASEVEAMTVPPVRGPAGLRIAAWLLVAGVVAALACAVVLLRSAPLSPYMDLAVLLRQPPASGASPLTLFAKAAALGAMRDQLLLAGLAILVGTLVNWSLRRSYLPSAGNIALAAAILVSLAAGHVALNTLAPVLTTEPLAATIMPVLGSRNRIVINAPYSEASSLGFYLQRDDLRELQQSGKRPARATFSDTAGETIDTLQHEWTGPERIFLWTDPAKLPPLLSKAYIVAEGGGKQIVSNRASQF